MGALQSPTSMVSSTSQALPRGRDVSRSQAGCFKSQHEHRQDESGHRDQGDLSKYLSPKTGRSNKRKLWARADAREYGGSSLQEPKLPAPWSRGVR